MFYIWSRGIKLVLSGIFVFVIAVSLFAFGISHRPIGRHAIKADLRFPIQSYSPLYSFIPKPNLLENNFLLLPRYFLMTTKLTPV